MNINFTDTELEQLLLAAKWTGIDSNTLVHNLVLDAVKELSETTPKTINKKVRSATNLSDKDREVIEQNITTLKLRNLEGLVIPAAITTYEELTKFLSQHYNLQGNIVFSDNSYELIAKDITRYKIHPKDLHSYLHYNYPDSNILKYYTDKELVPKTKGLGFDNNADKWRNLVNKGFVNKPRLGLAVRHKDRDKIKQAIDDLAATTYNKLNKPSK